MTSRSGLTARSASTVWATPAATREGCVERTVGERWCRGAGCRGATPLENSVGTVGHATHSSRSCGA
eukprot:5825476-Prymnesium_polylepis.1